MCVCVCARARAHALSLVHTCVQEFAYILVALAVHGFSHSTQPSNRMNDRFATLPPCLLDSMFVHKLPC